MPLDLYAAFVLATVVLIALPGPNVALIVANSVAHGRGYGLLTVAGTTAAMVPQLVLTVAGMTGALTLLSHVFEWVRWAGVAYLVYLGIQALRAPAVDLTRVRPEPKRPRDILLRGFLVSLTNPKTLLFYGAFLPQFVDPGAALLPQLVLLSVTFVVLAAGLDSCWALAAGRLRQVLAMRGRLRNRLTGGFYLAAALGLASARRAG
ncbi:LysE family translocator [Methyloraptor flagellatus]|jgi:threonine/homoserine/homoserine lactone efflux protein|uniref:LysE family translocator n=1 Tax=Methyloraptor flagellatus TaxID=3162530 RepID=A0AAU7XHN8_9HYPH